MPLRLGPNLDTVTLQSVQRLDKDSAVAEFSNGHAAAYKRDTGLVSRLLARGHKNRPVFRVKGPQWSGQWVNTFDYGLDEKRPDGLYTLSGLPGVLYRNGDILDNGVYFSSMDVDTPAMKQFFDNRPHQGRDAVQEQTRILAELIEYLGVHKRRTGAFGSDALRAAAGFFWQIPEEKVDTEWAPGKSALTFRYHSVLTAIDFVFFRGDETDGFGPYGDQRTFSELAVVADTARGRVSASFQVPTGTPTFSQVIPENIRHTQGPDMQCYEKDGSYALRFHHHDERYITLPEGLAERLYDATLKRANAISDELQRSGDVTFIHHLMALREAKLL